MSAKRQNMFSGTALTTSNPSSLSVRPQTKTEIKIDQEYHKQGMVAGRQAAKALMGQQLIATVIVSGAETYAVTVEEIEAIRNNDRSDKSQRYVDDFCEHISVRGGQMMAAAVEVGVKNIMREVDRDLYLEDVKPGFMARLLGGE